MYHPRTLLAFALIASVVGLGNAQCSFQARDLSGLQSPTDYFMSTYNGNVTFNVCKDTQLVCGQAGKLEACLASPQLGYIGLGALGSQKFALLADGQEGVSITYTGPISAGGSKQFTLNIVCDAGAPAVPTFSAITWSVSGIQATAAGKSSLVCGFKPTPTPVPSPLPKCQVDGIDLSPLANPNGFYTVTDSNTKYWFQPCGTLPSQVCSNAGGGFSLAGCENLSNVNIPLAIAGSQNITVSPADNGIKFVYSSTGSVHLELLFVCDGSVNGPPTTFSVKSDFKQVTIIGSTKYGCVTATPTPTPSAPSARYVKKEVHAVPRRIAQK